MQRMMAVIAILAELGLAGIVHAENAHKQVLVLHSTRRDAQISIVGESELPRILDNGLGTDLDYYAEFIDLARFPETGYQQALRQFLVQKYRGVRFDLIIALQDAATAFVDSQADSLFRDVPVVFLTNQRTTTRRAHSTGLVHERNFVDTVSLMRQLQPDLQQVFVVTGSARVDEQFESEIRRQLQSSGLPVTFTYLSGLPTPTLTARLSSLPPHAAVYHVLVTEDGAGNKFHPLEYVNRVAAAANAPTYCWVDSAMGRGIVGGGLYSQSAAIQHLGELALRVLRGESADSIPVGVLNLNENQVDWRQLRRWKIDGARVPQGTLMRFRDPTIWDHYKTYILGALAVLITQTVLIGGLLIQRKRRQRAEAELRANQDELRRSYERNRAMGSRLLKAQETERSRIAGELHDDICQRMLLLTIELESLGRDSRNEGPAVEALAVAKDIAKSLHELSHRLHPTRLRMLGLAAAIDHLCAELSRAGVAINYTYVNVPATLPSEVMLCLFRVVQEALQNAVKHSQGSDLLVDLRNGPDGLRVIVEDNGVGFDTDHAWGDGVGLISMVERIEAIGGSLEVRSTPGAGTRVTAVVPAAIVQATELAATV